MKEYLVRNVGWAYNDQHYELSGMNLIVERFQDYDSALALKDMLNEKALLEDFMMLYKFEIGSYDQLLDFRAKLGKLFTEAFKVNPSVKLQSPPWIDDIDIFPRALNSTELKQILSVGSINFFEIVEVLPEAEKLRYKGKVNPIYTGYDEYLMDSYGETDLQFYTKEAVTQFFLGKNLQDFQPSREGLSMLSGSTETLSDAPGLLKQLIADSEALYFTDSGRLAIKETIDLGTFNKLNGLLRHPILLYEEFSGPPLPRYKSGIIENLLFAKKQPWQVVEKRLQQHGNVIERVIESEAYLRLFVSYLPIFNPRLPYYGILRQHFPGYFPEDIMVGLRSTWRANSLFIYGLVITETATMGQSEITAAFCFDDATNIDFQNRIIGRGTDLERAYQDAFHHWLLQNRERIVLKLNSYTN